ncbi:MAG TPA: radical SAM protein [bacterium]|nr:radical SAM protein [bacterium]
MAKRKILFIYPSNEPSFPLQIAALSAYVKRSGHEASMLPLIIPKYLESSHMDDIKHKIEEYRPDFIGFSSYETAFPWITEISHYIKTLWPKIRIIVGGYYATLVPEEVISCPDIDIVCRGEGEIPLDEIMSDEENRKDILGLWIKRYGEIFKNSVRPLIEDLNSLPYPDREIFDYQEHLNYEPVGERNVKVMATRGCPYQCTYCSNVFLRKNFPNQDKYLRFRSPQNVIDEIKELKSKYIFERVGFHDDNLTLDTNWLKEFSKIYREEINLPFYCATRVERCTDEIIDILKEAGCDLVLLGIESGNEKYRKEMMKRYMSNEEIVNAFKRLKKKGILTWSFVMVGLPDEKRRMILETMWLNLRCNPDFVMASIFFPLKGTELGDYCYKKNYVNEKKKILVHSYAWDTILNHPFLSSFEIRMAKYLNSFTAFRSKFFWKVVGDRLRSRFFTPKH